MSAYSTSEPGYFNADDCRLEELVALTDQEVDQNRVPLATSIVKKIPLYDMVVLCEMLKTPAERRILMAEWAYVFEHGSGVLVLQNASADTDIIDDATKIYQQIIADERGGNGIGADHFAAAGKNDRIWNSLQKLCERSPETFAKYFALPAMDAACEAWLGPNYQLTAQVNLVRPGGQAQTCHRDYHLGFQTADMCARYPAHVHLLSPLMTLQGGLAHVDMPIESGPTKLLPFSQSYGPGYAAWRRDDFQAHFEDKYVQLPLSKGDAIFFNPALFHAAGENRSKDIERLVNLFQVGSAMGRTLENIDRIGMSKKLYPAMQSIFQAETLTKAQIVASIAACAEGYPFPTNLDTDPPVGGLAPESQAEIFYRALVEKWSVEKFNERLDKQAFKQRA